MSPQRSKRRPVTGFRLDPEVLAAFHARLREQGRAMQPTVEGWVKRWLASDERSPDNLLSELLDGQNDIRKRLMAVADTEHVKV